MRYILRYPVPHRRSLDYAETWLSAHSKGKWSIRFGGFMMARDHGGGRVQALSLTVLFEQEKDRRRFALDYLGTLLPDSADDSLTLEKLGLTEADSPAKPSLPAEPPAIDVPVRASTPLRRQEPVIIAPGNKKIIDLKA
ncbi:hypothetical protein [Oceanibaculum nanhaiense]|jgi:hypothetical protein|uniref:hypothetical protein n=1 Tax=Oceanibaculum nanhaiense TaxID=1909734 RepID=UPI000A3B8C17|nr:hypothetical protein [Oceanibaculum nanhaiense]MBC7134599.1 hypothetical protein [Oceanibaculum nanhaiense]|tara:strand:+ start:92 stop:508 length:417 start_codon:yes stop_codon:yes gene_type:complete